MMIPLWADSLEPARNALADGLPQVAVQKVREAAPDALRGKGDSEGVLLLARALVESGRATEALTLLSMADGLPACERDFWTAQALAGEGRAGDALNHYWKCIESDGCSKSREAALGAARMLFASGEKPEAVALLESARDWPASPLRDAALLDLAAAALDLNDLVAAKSALDAIPEVVGPLLEKKKFLLARTYLADGDFAAAAGVFAEVDPLDERMAVETATGQAKALQMGGNAAAAETLLEEFIESHVSIQNLDAVFVALDELYAASASPSSSEMRRWTDTETPSPRRSLALFYRARMESRANRNDLARRLLERLLNVDPDHPLAEQAAVEVARNWLEAGRADDALGVLPPPGRVPAADYVRGLALASRNEPEAAAGAFQKAAVDETLAESALFNAALCNLEVGVGSEAALVDLQTRFPESPRLAKFRLHEALHLARTKDPAALARLETLANEKGPESSAARLALAELRFEKGDLQAARLELRQVSDEVDPARRGALDVFLVAGSGESPDAAIAAAQTFLKDHPGSASEPEVRMKLGELLFRKGDFAGARVQFESLARKYPGPPWEEPALFLAGQSASRLLSAEATGDALLLFEEVAGFDGPLASRARLEQAFLQSAAGRRKEAMVIIDRILGSPVDAETRFAALMEKGKAQYLSGQEDPAQYREAIVTWRSITTDPEATPEWKNQALVRMGTAFEKLGETDAALAAFYDVIKGGQGTVPEYFWFYKAGFDAARILESQKRWEEAVRVYEMVSAVDGPRAPEVRARINRIRLENFLWDGT